MSKNDGGPIDLESLRGHTPGPWSTPYCDDTPGDRGWWVHNGLRGSREFAVAVTFSLNPNGEADARLIAAAPTLLAEYERLLAELTTRRARDAEVGALVAALREAMEWNWLDEDASPSTVADQCEKALAPFAGDKT